MNQESTLSQDASVLRPFRLLHVGDSEIWATLQAHIGCSRVRRKFLDSEVVYRAVIVLVGSLMENPDRAKSDKRSQSS